MKVNELKSVLSAWENKTGSTVHMDSIKSSRKFSAGWLQFAHPRYVNRDELKKWIISQSQDIDVSGWFKIFARGIFESDAEQTKKTLTHAIVIDGSLDNVEEFMQFLYSIEWKDQYSGVNFIPFQKDEYFTEKEHQLAIKQHNVYLRSLEMEVITIKNPDTIFQTQEGHSGTVLQWLSAQGVDDKKLFQHVTQIGATKVLLSFYGEFKQSVSQSKLSHSKLLKARITGNPQSCDDDVDTSPPSVSTNRGYYGKPPIQPTVANTKTFVDVLTNHTYHAATTPDVSQETNDKIAELENMINGMKSDNKKIHQDIQATNNSIQELSTTLHKRIDGVQEASSKLVNNFIDAQKRVNEEKERKENEFKDWIRNTLTGKQETPSGVEPSCE